MSTGTFAFALAAALMVAGALAVVFVKEIMRLVIGLGTFLLGVAGLFLFYGHAFVATAQVFVYVGGVLVLIVFAVMVVHRGPAGRPVLASRHDFGAAAVAFGVSAMIVLSLRGSVGGWVPTSGAGSDAALATELLGGKLVAFEMAGGLLLLALVAVLVIAGAGERR